MKKYYLSLILIVLSSNVYSQISEEPIMLRAKDCDIQGTLMMPKEQATTVVLIVAGTGGVDRDGNQTIQRNYAYKMYAYALAVNNIASVRYDKRGVGASALKDPDLTKLTFSQYVDDVIEWVNLLAKDKRFTKIVIAGHSEGSLLAIAALSQGCKANALISLSGRGRTYDVVMKEQFASQPQQIRDIAYSIIDTLKMGRTISDVPIFLNRFNLFHPQMQPYIISSFKYNPKTLIRNVKVPILIIQGDTDIQVKVEDARLLAEGNPKSKLVIISGMNNVLKECPTLNRDIQIDAYSNPSYPLSQKMVAESVKFIESIP